MIFPYECKKCSKRFDAAFPIGQAPRETRCPACKGLSGRVYGGMSFMLKTNGSNGGISRSSTFGEEMKARNTAAGNRMRGKKALKTVAYDYGNGDVRENK